MTKVQGPRNGSFNVSTPPIAGSEPRMFTPLDLWSLLFGGSSWIPPQPAAARRNRLYEGTERNMNAREISSLRLGKVLDRTPEQMQEMYRAGGSLLPKGQYWEKLHDHGTGKAWRLEGDGTAILRTSNYPRRDGHRPVTIDVVDVSKLKELGLSQPKTREEVEALKRAHPEVITSVRTRTNADVAIKLQPGHEYVAMGPSGTMSMMAGAHQMTSNDSVSWS